jgi:hypothetical protein
MKPIRVSEIHEQGEELPIRDEHLPTAPDGYKWAVVGVRNWQYLTTYDAQNKLILWCVRGADGTLCIGPMNHEGYEIERSDNMTTVVTQVLTMHRIGICTKC